MQALKSMDNTPLALNLGGSIMPRLSYCASKWSELRQSKVEAVRDLFFKKPESVYIFKDSKFEGAELALLKKDHLEGLIKLNEDLSSGEAAILESFEGMFLAVETLVNVIEASNADEKDEVLKSALQSVKFQIKATYKKSILYKNAPEDKASAELTEKEKSMFQDIIDEEGL